MTRFELHHGDCLAALRVMPDSSVDSIVTDPPYGLSFMGRKWDYDVPSVEIWAECLRVLKPGGHLLAFAGTRTQHRMAVRIEDAGFEIRDMIAWVYASGMPKSMNIDRVRGDKICGCAFPKTHNGAESKTKRDLRPVRPADVSPAVDIGEGGGKVLQPGMQEQGASALEATQGFTGNAGAKEPGLEGRGDAPPEARKLCAGSVREGSEGCCVDGPEGRVCHGAPVGDGEVGRPHAASDRGCASRGPQPVEQRARESGAMAGQQKSQALGAWPLCGGCGLPRVPAGLGTALKPALEPITVARKPLATCATNVLDKVESQLRERGVRGEILWKPENASGAARSKKAASSDSTRHLGQSATSAKNADESVTQSVEKQSLKSSGLLGTSGLNQTPDGSASFQGCTTSACANPSSQPTAESAPAAESKSATSSPLTTSTAAELNTGSRSTEKCTPNYGATDSLPDTESFAGIATGLTGSMATVRINRDSQGFFLWPRGLPEFVPGSPLTVAANVLEHGTGALNIDGCRVGSDVVGWGGARGGSDDSTQSQGRNYRLGEGAARPVEGRWPANILHDGSDEVLEQFPDSNGAVSNGRKGKAGIFEDGIGAAEQRPGYADDGSAARFFYCAKASKRDRDEGLEGFEVRPTAAMAGNMVDGQRLSGTGQPIATPTRANHHPTVKPTDLMRYLCRLVTPPGGVVLDPFMGSGSTGKAAMLEGFRFIGIEREAEYLAIAEARISAVAPEVLSVDDLI